MWEGTKVLFKIGIEKGKMCAVDVRVMYEDGEGAAGSDHEADAEGGAADGQDQDGAVAMDTDAAADGVRTPPVESADATANAEDNGDDDDDDEVDLFACFNTFHHSEMGQHPGKNENQDRYTEKLRVPNMLPTHYGE